MFTDSQLEKASFILEYIKSNGNISPETEFDTLFDDQLCNAGENKMNIIREIHFVTACLKDDFKLIRTIHLNDEYGNSRYTALTQKGAIALKDGLPIYLRNIEKEENRTIITKYWTFWASLIATFISVTTFIFGFGKLG